jgi:hypothetical protein
MHPPYPAFFHGDSTLRQLITPGLMQLVALTVFPIIVPASTGAGKRVDLTLFNTGVFVLISSCWRTSYVMSGNSHT